MAGLMEATALTDLDFAVAGAVETAAPRASTFGVSLLLAAGTLGECIGEPEGIRFVLDRLLGNALTWTPPGGEVILGGRRAGELCVLHVADSGFGTPATIADRDVLGLWPGLDRCKKIVQMHGGRIRVESAPGFGTTFSVLLAAAGAR